MFRYQGYYTSLYWDKEQNFCCQLSVYFVVVISEQPQYIQLLSTVARGSRENAL